MKTRKIVKVTIKEMGKEMYFSSISAINKVIPEMVERSEFTIRNYMSKNNTPVYETDKIKIEKDLIMYIDSKNRTIKPENISTAKEVEQRKKRKDGE